MVRSQGLLAARAGSAVPTTGLATTSTSSTS
jgi:hypothetical protein